MATTASASCFTTLFLDLRLMRVEPARAMAMAEVAAPRASFGYTIVK